MNLGSTWQQWVKLSRSKTEEQIVSSFPNWELVSHCPSFLPYAWISHPGQPAGLFYHITRVLARFVIALCPAVRNLWGFQQLNVPLILLWGLPSQNQFTFSLFHGFSSATSPSSWPYLSFSSLRLPASGLFGLIIFSPWQCVPQWQFSSLGERFWT